MSTLKLGHLSHLSQMESPKVTKVSNAEPGHLSDNPYPRPGRAFIGSQVTGQGEA